MKKILLFAIFALVLCFMASAQTTKETIKERKLIARQSHAELTARVAKEARKAAKTLKKEGWLVAPGQLPLEKQLDKAFNMKYEYEENGLPKYIIGEAKAVGGAYDAARMQAVNNAKIELAGLISTEVTALTESTVGNNQISSEDATSINEAVQAGKSLIVQKLGRTFVVTECYRQLNKKNVEVSVTIAYNEQMAMDMAKAVIRKNLEEKGKDLHEQLDKMWDSLKE